ncbi:MAG: DNA polymerase III subunit delta' [Amphiplicatus sp.]
MTDRPPHQRETVTGRAGLEAELRRAVAGAAISNGWIIAGPKGAGKATLAYRLARAILDPEALTDASSLQMSAKARSFRLIAQNAHPDLFVAQRRHDEKNDRYETEISVETARALTSFLSKTAAGGGWRVAIVDAADDLNRNAANALLKSLEEPPAKTALLLLAHAPGRLLATIRSRCRRIALRPVPDAEIAALLCEEAGADPETAGALARAARGRPGYALTLAAGEGEEAVAAAGEFFSKAVASGDVGAVAASLAGKAALGRWEIFQELVLEQLSDAARAQARGRTPSGPLAALSAPVLFDAHQRLAALLRRGEAVNIDRRDLVLAMGRGLHAFARDAAA